MHELTWFVPRRDRPADDEVKPVTWLHALLALALCQTTQNRAAKKSILHVFKLCSLTDRQLYTKAKWDKKKTCARTVYSEDISDHGTTSRLEVDYCLHLHCYSHKFSADTSFSLLWCLMSNLAVHTQIFKLKSFLIHEGCSNSVNYKTWERYEFNYSPSIYG